MQNSELKNDTDKDINKLMIFTIDNRQYGIDIMVVREIRSWMTITPLPRSPDYIRGVINIRGTVLPIMDLARRLSPNIPFVEKRNVIVVLEIGERVFGILVDQVSDIVQKTVEDVKEVPSATSESVRELVSGLVTHEDCVVCLLRPYELLPMPVAA